MRKTLLAFTAACLVSTVALAQDRPLRTTDVETVPAGDARAEVGFDFLQDVAYPLSGLRFGRRA